MHPRSHHGAWGSSRARRFLFPCGGASERAARATTPRARAQEADQNCDGVLQVEEFLSLAQAYIAKLPSIEQAWSVHYMHDDRKRRRNMEVLQQVASAALVVAELAALEAAGKGTTDSRVAAKKSGFISGDVRCIACCSDRTCMRRGEASWLER